MKSALIGGLMGPAGKSPRPLRVRTSLKQEQSARPSPNPRNHRSIPRPAKDRKFISNSEC